MKKIALIKKYIKNIAIEGCIGIGKTTLCNILAKKLDIQPILEQFKENPFLPHFYKNNIQHAFKTQLFFLLSRYNQKILNQKQYKKKITITDYHIIKDRIFAEINLKGKEKVLYHQLFNTLYPKIHTPDILIYLKASIHTIIKRIKQRNRIFEKNINQLYLMKIIQYYDLFFSQYPSTHLLTIDTEFFNSSKEEKFIAKLIKTIYKIIAKKNITH